MPSYLFSRAVVISERELSSLRHWSVPGLALGACANAQRAFARARAGPPGFPAAPFRNFQARTHPRGSQPRSTTVHAAACNASSRVACATWHARSRVARAGVPAEIPARVPRPTTKRRIGARSSSVGSSMRACGTCGACGACAAGLFISRTPVLYDGTCRCHAHRRCHATRR